MTAQTISSGSGYVQAIAGEVRAMAARRAMSHKQVGAALGHDEMWTSRRMRGMTPWTGDELMRLAVVFGCKPSDLLPHLDSNQKPFGYGSAALFPRREHLSLVA
jgi:hypothetical protein